jgi:hypothetical protein
VQRPSSRPLRGAQHLRPGADRQRVAFDLEAYPFIPFTIWDHAGIERQAHGVDRLEGIGGGKLTTTARYTHVATKTIRDTVSPYEMLAKLQDQTVKRSLE